MNINNSLNKDISTSRRHIFDLLKAVEQIRRDVNGTINPSTRAKYSQFMTPAITANYMASLFRKNKKHIRLLDPGAGIGSLTTSFIAKYLRNDRKPESIHVTAYEIDSFLCKHLAHAMNLCEQACIKSGIDFSSDIRQQDFILASTQQDSSNLFDGFLELFDCVILNPPYSKIKSKSDTRLMLRNIGVETSNLYTAFLALSARHLYPRGEMVSITPRSFCNGQYFLAFRKYFHALVSFNKFHVFESRSIAFKEDDVLQENIILHASRTQKRPPKISISISVGPAEKIEKRSVPYKRVINDNDPDLFINLITNKEGDNAANFIDHLPATLFDLEIQVSTGRVVDFRAKEYLRNKPIPGSVPLIYPGHFNNGKISWPSDAIKKPNAILAKPDTKSLLVPVGIYVLVKRFSAKEERRRIVASVYNLGPKVSKEIGFENHLNYFHCNGKGLTHDLAFGLCAFLNSSVVDTYFRLFSGHTQVNAMDLRRFRYPTSKQLNKLGKIMQKEILTNNQLIDKAIEELLD